MKKATKYGIYKYATENIGDEIQTIAMMRFIPRVDYVFDRDNINSTEIAKDDEVKLIMNGWYMHNKNGNFDWPPESANLSPLLISMYLERDVPGNRADLAFFTKESRKFLSEHGPVGARDIGTMQFLKDNGVDSYFSGCMTLTLLPDSRIKRQDYVLAVDVSDKMYNFLVGKTGRKVIRLNANHGSDLPYQEKVAIARYWLCLYQSAHCIVTGRLHAILPGLALGTPVLAIKKKDNHRFEGLVELANGASEKDILSGKVEYNIDNPPANPTNYKNLARELTKSCFGFTGYDSEKSFLGDNNLNSLLFDESYINTVTDLVERSHEYFKLKTHDKEMAVAYKMEAEKRKKDLAELRYLQDKISHPSLKDAAKIIIKSIIKR